MPSQPILRQPLSLGILLGLLLSGCANPPRPVFDPSKPVQPFRGTLEAGKVFHAIVETGTSPFAHTTFALFANKPGPQSAVFLDFTNAPHLELETPTMVV